MGSPRGYRNALCMRTSMLYALPLWLRGLLDRVEEEMILRGHGPSSRKSYIAHLKRFYLARVRPAPLCSSEEVQSWLLDLHRRGCSQSCMTQTLSAMKFVHEKVLGEPGPTASIPRSGEMKRLPSVLSEEEVA